MASCAHFQFDVRQPPLSQSEFELVARRDLKLAHEVWIRFVRLHTAIIVAGVVLAIFLYLQGWVFASLILLPGGVAVAIAVAELLVRCGVLCRMPTGRRGGHYFQDAEEVDREWLKTLRALHERHPGVVSDEVRAYLDAFDLCDRPVLSRGEVDALARVQHGHVLEATDKDSDLLVSIIAARVRNGDL